MINIRKQSGEIMEHRIEEKHVHQDLIGFEEFLAERAKQKKHNLIDSKIYIVFRIKKGTETTRELIIGIDFRAFLFRWKKEWKVTEISGIFSSKRAATAHAQEILKKFNRKKKS